MLVGTNTFALTNQVTEQRLYSFNLPGHFCGTEWVDCLQFREITFLFRERPTALVAAYHIFSIWEADSRASSIIGEEIVSGRIDYTLDPILVAASRIQITKRYVRLCVIGYDNTDVPGATDYFECLAIRSNAVRTSEVDNS